MLKETLRKLGPEFGILTESESAEVEQNVMNRLDRSVKLDEVDTITFGLETDDGKIVKVYVKADQAEDFEKALSDKLGEVDDIEEVLNDLSKDYEIIDVEWPEDETESDEEEEDDGSSVLDPKVHGNAKERAAAETKIKSGAVEYTESLTVGEKFTMDLLEGVNASSIEARFTTPSQLMVYHAILELGIPEIALSRSPHRAIIIKQIKDKALELVKSSQMKNALKLFINNSVDYDEKAASNKKKAQGGKEKLKDSKQVEGELLAEGVASDFWSTFTALINYIAKTPEDAAKLLDDTKVTQLRTKSVGSLTSKVNSQLKAKMLALKDAMMAEEVTPDSYFVSGLQLNEGASTTEILDLITNLLSLADPSKDKTGAKAVLGSAAWQTFFNGAKPTLMQKFVGQGRSKLNNVKLALSMTESKDPAWMSDHKNKNAKLAHAYQYGSEKFDEGHMIEVIGEEGDSYIVKPFPIMANGHMKLKKTAVKLLGKINVPDGGTGGRMPGGLNESVPEWSFEMNDDDLYVISCNSLKVGLNDEEIEKLIKGITNKDAVIVRDNDDPTHKVAFSPRGSSIMVKKVGTPEGIMMKQKDVDGLLDFISDGEEATPDEEDEDKANPDVKAKKDKEAKVEKEDGKMKE